MSWPLSLAGWSQSQEHNIYFISSLPQEEYATYEKLYQTTFLMHILFIMSFLLKIKDILPPKSNHLSTCITISLLSPDLTLAFPTHKSLGTFALFDP